MSNSTTDIRYTAFISPALHATLLAWKPEPQPINRKTAQDRRVGAILKRMARAIKAIDDEREAREAAFQERVNAISDEIYHPFRSHERCELSSEPTLSSDQRRAYTLQAEFASAGKREKKRMKRELNDMRRRERYGEMQS